MRRVFFVLVVLVGLLSLAGCSAQYHLRRAVAKDPSLLKTKIVNKTIVDSVYVNDTIRVAGRDTIFSFVPIKGNWQTAYEDSRTKLQIIKAENGKLKFKLSEKPLIIYYNAIIPHKTEVSFEIPPVANITPTIAFRDYIKIAFVLVLLYFFYSFFIRKR